RNIVGEAQYLFVVGIVPLHRYVDADHRALIGRAFAGGLENRRMQRVLGAVDVFNEAARAAFEGEILFLAGSLVAQLDMHAIVQEGQFADALGQDVVMEFDIGEDAFIRPEVHFGAALVGVAEYLDRRDFHAIPDFDFAVLRDAARKFHLVQLAVAAYRQLQGLGQRIDAGDAHAVQAAGYLVGV